jgi:hypothetical protein
MKMPIKKKRWFTSPCIMCGIKPGFGRKVYGRGTTRRFCSFCWDRFKKSMEKDIEEEEGEE